MLVINRDGYDLLMNVDACSIFTYYGVEEMHGLNLTDCRKHPNTNEGSYICGWANHIPHEGEYKLTDRMFCFINLNRCNSELDLICNLFHELMHVSFNRFNEDIELEEEMITWAEQETREIYKLTKYLI